ncbi:hypothetical protein EDB95_4674 [Dinghuibacter silviterrae]|uniref:Uncharacterized protein n=1 Tax=Dinghuibacter silviterrae TaxID=1539049 RepID=A0A4R8DHD4_9BACT|nr:hypothetical protein EDB95_4674 [Dinghuibacter silviterrae]
MMYNDDKERLIQWMIAMDLMRKLPRKIFILEPTPFPLTSNRQILRFTGWNSDASKN